MNVGKAMTCIRTLKEFFERKRDLFNDNDLEIDGKKVRDMNRAMWQDFIEVLDEALSYLKDEGVIWTEKTELIA